MERSWSSNTNLLPPLAVSRTDFLPNLVLGTWAAASMPIGHKNTKPSALVVDDAPSPPSENNDDETETHSRAESLLSARLPEQQKHDAHP